MSHFGVGEVNIFFYLPVLCFLVVGVVILFVELADLVSFHWELIAVAVGLFMVCYSLCVIWVKRKLYDEFAEVFG
jgi:amino acid transporter